MNKVHCPPFEICSLFTGVANTTSTPLGWEGGGQMRSHEVVGKGYVFSKNSQVASTGAIFTSTCQVNPWQTH